MLVVVIFPVSFVAVPIPFRDSSLFATLKVEASFLLDASGNQFDSNFIAFETLANGQVNNFGPGTSHGVRITLEPPAL
jgi:hypothetical protein